MTQKGVTSVTSFYALSANNAFDHHVFRQRRLSSHVLLDDQVKTSGCH